MYLLPDDAISNMRGGGAPWQGWPILLWWQPLSPFNGAEQNNALLLYWCSYSNQTITLTLRHTLIIYLQKDRCSHTDVLIYQSISAVLHGAESWSAESELCRIGPSGTSGSEMGEASLLPYNRQERLRRTREVFWQTRDKRSFFVQRSREPFFGQETKEQQQQ